MRSLPDLEQVSIVFGGAALVFAWVILVMELCCLWFADGVVDQDWVLAVYQVSVYMWSSLELSLGLYVYSGYCA